MIFQNIVKKKSKLLLPFSWLYKAGMVLHQKTYEWGLKKSETFQLPIICVGNLSVGGTGKTPMVEYLLRLLTPQFSIATVSRGYKRKSKGIFIADENTTTAEIGDEPMQFHTKFPAAKIVVGERRAEAIKELMNEFPATEVIILDDAFQHRAVKAGLNILLTDYNNLFTDDFHLPAGQLRDLKENYKNAEIIVVTKCPADLPVPHKYHVIKKINPLINQQVYFTTITYAAPYNIFNHSATRLESIENAVLVTGIANPQPLIDHLKRHDIGLKTISFPDHHRFSQSDIDEINQVFQSINEQNKIILTTEKDAMRLKEFEKELHAIHVFAIPVEHSFLFNERNDFNNVILDFIKSKS